MYRRLKNKTFADDNRYSNLMPPPPPPPMGGGGTPPPPPPAPYPYPYAIGLPVSYGLPPLYETEYVVYDTPDATKTKGVKKSTFSQRDILLFGIGVVSAVLLYKLVK